MSERILIKFKASGDNRLRASMIKLAGAQSLLEKNTKEFRKALSNLSGAFDKTERRSRLLNNSFATLRSKMLLFSFAMSMGGRQLIQFGKQAANLEAMETAFTNLQGGTENAAIAMDRLRAATDNTMSNFDLFQQANNAMILGITTSSEEMAQMFDMAQRLGEALGKDTRHSVESLITGIGRQSRLMLDNIGIIVDTEKAYKNYAKQIDVTVDQLTDADKKQAFFNATMDSAKQKLKGIGPEVDTPIRAFNRFSASMTNLGTSIGEDFLVAAVPLLNMLSGIANALENVNFAQVAKQASIFAAAIFTVTKSGRRAVKTLIAFKASMIGLASGTKKATLAMAKFKRASIVFIALEGIVFALEKTIGFFGNSSKENFEEATESVNEYVVALGGVPNTTKDLTAEQDILNEKLLSIKKAVPDIRDLKKEYESLIKIDTTEFLGQNIEFLDVEAQKEMAAFFTSDILPAIKQTLGVDKESLNVKVALSLINQKLLDIELQKEVASKSLIPNLEKEIAMIQLKTQFEGTRLVLMQELLKVDQKDLDLNDFELFQLSMLIIKKQELLKQISDEEKEKRRLEKAERDAARLRENQISDAQAIVDSMKSEMEIIEEQITLYEALRFAAIGSRDVEAAFAYGQALDVLNQQAIDLKETLEDAKLEKFLDMDVVNAFSNAFSSEIVRAIETGKMSLESFGRSFFRVINQMIAEIIAAETLKGFFKLAMMFINPAGGVTASLGSAVGTEVFPAVIPYHSGGMIRGRQQGGDVPMVGQEGEFVMRRSAVESIGLENMNRMNRTGRVGGGANITFTGNIMSDTFIEEEAIPKIKDAIRRGEDLGIN